MASLKRHEGFLMIDHRASPGLPEVPEGTLFEAAILTCSHCQVTMIRNPARTRARAYCTGCDHYICDRCAEIRFVSLQCHDIQRVFDQVQHDALTRLHAEKAG
jgi:hypothetical protein